MSSFFTECLKDEARAINYAASKLCERQVDKSLKIVENCFERKSKVIISGVGKSGIVARKMAATFTSAGGMAVYLNPLDALHGDIGILNESDVCILLSNSGETKEILDLIPHLKKRNLKIISLVGNQNSSIGRLSNAVLETNVDKEICPLNLAPTTSTTVAMAIGDAIATEWMRRKGVTTQEFAYHHPAGSLGKKISLKVTELMIPGNKLHLLTPDDNFTEILKVITTDGLGTACVTDQKKRDKLVGIITDGDLRRSLERFDSEDWKNLKAKDIMTKEPLCINSSKLAIEALEMMEGKENKIVWSLPIIDSERGLLIGLVRLHHLVQAGLKEV